MKGLKEKAARIYAESDALGDKGKASYYRQCAVNE